ncbi:hypothetical protein [Maridesulfovibrio ferrireducens]|uniref:hypothetical protein n=1 Tax=Maridesulfovibrio ferrireducens TaxID=246191 RepID=UPI001A2D5270|nr:hypothetical protein [Maridesulfovibrio ferrireducens]MBI9110322.1 hypothetical protein [Maridesulfovibrio ferrireducens]
MADKKENDELAKGSAGAKAQDNAGESENIELKKKLAEAKAALKSADEEKAKLECDLDQEKKAREEAEAENRKLDDHVAKLEGSELERQKAEEKVKIFIAEGEGAEGRDDVFVGAQGISYQIKRGVEVKVPMSVYNILNDSAYTAYEESGDGEDIEYVARAVPRYNIRVVE